MPSLPIYPELPEMRCDAGCRECCSEAVPVTEDELVAVVLYANERDIVPQEREPQMCPWYDTQAGRCAVHPVRPLVCHAFGHLDSLECARGYNANTSDPELLVRQLRALGPRTRFLHEVRKTGAVAVCEEAWMDVQMNRQRAGLPPLRGKVRDHG